MVGWERGQTHLCDSNLQLVISDDNIRTRRRSLGQSRTTESELRVVHAATIGFRFYTLIESLYRPDQNLRVQTQALLEMLCADCEETVGLRDLDNPWQ